MPPVPVSSVVCAKGLHSPLGVNSGRMLLKAGMLHDLRADAVLPCCSVFVLNDTGADAILRRCSVLVLNDTRAHPVLVHNRPPVAAIENAFAGAARSYPCYGTRRVRNLATRVAAMVRVPRRRYCREGKSAGKNSNQCESTGHCMTFETRGRPYRNPTATTRHACVVITPL